MGETFRESLIKDKALAEGQFVLSMASDPDLYYDYPLKTADFHTPGWALYFGILATLIRDKGVTKVDSIAFETQVKSLPKTGQDVVDDFGGWTTIQKGMRVVEAENAETYYSEINRYKVLIKLLDDGFPIEKKWGVLKNLSLEEISDYLEGKLSAAFIDTESTGEVVHDINDGLDENLKAADEGIHAGLPFSSVLINSVQNGMSTGNITMFAAQSGLGKSFMALTQMLPVAVRFQEPMMLLINEEDRKKWQYEIITWAINNLFDGDFNKSRFYQGHFSPEEWELINKGSDWMKTNIESGLIRFVEFQSFSMGKAIKYIKKYSKLYEVKYFLIDTLKLDNDTSDPSVSDKSWLQLQQNMVKLYNTIKKSAADCHVVVTYQMNKSQRERYLTQNDLGMSKNVADVVTSLILFRLAGANEKGDGKTALSVKTQDGKRKKLNPDKDYFILFWDKNRQGQTSRQVVVEVDRGRNIVKDIGLTQISPEY